MLPKLHISYGLNEARQFKVIFLRFTVHCTVPMNNSELCYLKLRSADPSGRAV